MENKTYIKNIKTIKFLGKGMFGSVFLAEDQKDKKKKYALKVEHILPKDIKRNFRSPLWREIDFAKFMGKKYPLHFMKLYKHKIQKCDYQHDIKNKLQGLNNKSKKFYQKSASSPYCSIKLYSLVDDMLHNIIYKIANKQKIYDLYIQTVYLAYLINKHQYYHSDLHPKNIGVIKTKEKYITILGHKIPTHHYILQALDYGSIKHKKYKMDKYEKRAYKYTNDISGNFYKLIFKIMLRNLTNKYPNVDINQKVTISKEDKKIIYEYIKNTKIDSSKYASKNYAFYEELLYKLLFFNKFQEELKIKKKVKLYTFMPLSSVIYIFQNVYNIKKVLLYLLKNRSGNRK